jgi:hypothetical protein
MIRSIDIDCDNAKSQEVIHEAFVLAGLMKAGRCLPEVEIERGKFHLHGILHEYANKMGGRLPSPSIVARELAMRIMPIFAVEQLEENVEREEETLS